MKILSTFLLVFALLFVSCSSSKDSARGVKTVKGRVFVVGNSPFTRMALQTDSTTVYLLDCSDEIRKQLSSHQGKFAEVSYEDTVQTPQGKTLKVIEATLIPGKQ
ncbi:MAG: hypothetical protein HF314_17395 [Ignavibacteria bacterium]|jgi:hypothetical protein|nr:hypothetical protein [Ignavibacteria bacterium]MCU7504862.1 hypothetical protein [Ignavibacteria bacterium]MCU7518326.1 hypothetical protein [Ignavibacteria bacterium]